MSNAKANRFNKVTALNVKSRAQLVEFLKSNGIHVAATTPKTTLVNKVWFIVNRPQA